jgi:hypothetical protein
MFYSDLTANRPTAGIAGRIFIATDSPYGLFRDTGSAWEQVAGSGGGGGNTIYTANDTLTSDRVVSSGGFGLSFTSTTYIGTATIGSGSGKLIVGSSSADNGIQVFGANSPSLRIDNAATGGTQRLVIGLSTATNNFIQGSTAGQFCISTASSGALLFGMWQTINASEVMRISTSNNLLIGLTIDSGYKLDISGSVKFGTSGASTGMYWDNINNKLGIGVSSPQTSLHINQSNVAGIGQLCIQDSAYQQITFFNGSPTNLANRTMSLYSDGSTIFLQNAKSGSFSITASSTILSGSFQVGSLSFFLDTITITKNQSGLFESVLSSTSTTGVSRFAVRNDSNTSDIFLTTYGSSTAFTIFGVSSPTTSVIGSQTASILALGTFNSAPLIFGTNNAERSRITATGNLLLGSTTDSGEKLQITGIAKITGSLYTGNTSNVGIWLQNATSIRGTATTGGNIYIDANSSLDGTGTINLRGLVNSGTLSVAGNLTVTGQQIFVPYNGGLKVNTASNGNLFLDASADYTGNVFSRTTSFVIEYSGGLPTSYASALFVVNSTTKGFLPPRMTNAQILAISTPATGLEVYNTDLNQPCFYDGTGWRKVSHSAM